MGEFGRALLGASLFMTACAAEVAAEPGWAVEGMEIPKPLTNEPGNPDRGKRIVRNAANATCLICHAMPIPEEPDHGTLGPPLHGIGGRMSEGEIRLRLVDPKRINPETIMPAYFRTEGLYGVDDPYRGKTIYTAQEVEDVVAYLMTLKKD